MGSPYGNSDYRRFLLSGIDWAGLVKSDLSVDGLSHFTLTPSEHWAHTHTLIHSRRAHCIIDISASEHSRGQHIEGKLLF